MTGYTKWDRDAYIKRVGGIEEAERRRKALMARQCGHRPPRSKAASCQPSRLSPATSRHSADG
jgi:hypothetical protein